ncbi:GNAT family N-acetyltransferase [Sphingomonas sp. VNH70]|uniref:GNAT family N-acetyltransferase n=1 Tax=Sphingomonas silueang TaxID=3156617 RepID=UPI0032B5DEE5
MTIALSDDRDRLDIDRIHAWLAASYWSPGIARDLVARAIAGSQPIGAYRDGVQVGFARAITDRATFAWIADVFVDDAARGQGIGRAMVRWLVDHPDLAGIRRIGLVTADAHGVYAPLGFHPLLRPERYMERLSAEAAAMLKAMP